MQTNNKEIKNTTSEIPDPRNPRRKWSERWNMQLLSYYNYIQEIQDNCLMADLSPINLNTSTLYEGKDKEMEQKLRHWAKAGQRPVRPRMGPLGGPNWPFRSLDFPFGFRPPPPLSCTFFHFPFFIPSPISSPKGINNAFYLVSFPEFCWECGEREPWAEQGKMFWGQFIRRRN